MSTVEMFNTLYREHAERVRAIAAATGVDRNTVMSDLRQVAEIQPPDPEIAAAGVQNRTPQPPSERGLLLVIRAAADHYRLFRSTRERATDLTDPLAGRIVPAAPSAEDVALMHEQIAELLAEAVAAVAR